MGRTYEHSCARGVSGRVLEYLGRSDGLVRFRGETVLYGEVFDALAPLRCLAVPETSLQQYAAEGDKAKMASLRLLAIGLGTAALMPVVGHFAAGSLGAGFWSVAATMTLFALGGLVVARHHRPRTTTATEAGPVRGEARPSAAVAVG
ncbi:hypothetical protein [Streptomyces erythrochromogenes]|uniref:hypothetical protein n=1 Tax=Streptomyces erythrochromogenes TaxID=285574 RepID=UPI00225847FF|nr:hypothetical protein [Streptomyces erythrochromogenes]MCX5585593.1 hypothetical protein [Streptomyces erythrochromogenes]